MALLLGLTKLKYSYNVGLWGLYLWWEILTAQGLPESAYLKQVTKEGSEQLRLTFEKGELKAVNDEKFDDPIKAIQKWRRSAAFLRYRAAIAARWGYHYRYQRACRIRGCCSYADYRSPIVSLKNIR